MFLDITGGGSGGSVTVSPDLYDRLIGSGANLPPRDPPKNRRRWEDEPEKSPLFNLDWKTQLAGVFFFAAGTFCVATQLPSLKSSFPVPVQQQTQLVAVLPKDPEFKPPFS